MQANNNEIEKRLWEAADKLRANSKLKASEYSGPVLGLIFLRYAEDARCSEMEIRKKLIEANAVDVMVSIGPNFFLHRDAALHALVF